MACSNQEKTHYMVFHRARIKTNSSAYRTFISKTRNFKRLVIHLIDTDTCLKILKK